MAPDTLGRTTYRLVSAVTSIRFVIPVVLVTIAASMYATIRPDPEIFQSTWFLALLALLSVSLLLITVIRAPRILRQKGRASMIGVVITHAGVIVLLLGMLYGGSAGFRQRVQLIEGEFTVLPGLPFQLVLESVAVEYFDNAPAFPVPPKKRQDLTISIHRYDEAATTTVISPGNPGTIDGYTILPTIRDPKTYFELVVTGPNQFPRVVPFDPESTVITNVPIKTRNITAHPATHSRGSRVEVLELTDSGPVSLGFAAPDNPLQIDNYTVALGAMKPSIAVLIYRRPQMPVLVTGCLITFAGLIWHFMHRNRTGTWDRRKPMHDS